MMVADPPESGDSRLPRMPDDVDVPTTFRARLSAVELADLVSDPVERVEELTTRGVLAPDEEGRYAPGDAHRIRVVDGFEAAGVPLDVLVRAQEAGLISVAYYDELHGEPGRPSARTYQAFKESLGARGDLLPAMFGAFGIAEPDAGEHVDGVRTGGAAPDPAVARDHLEQLVADSQHRVQGERRILGDEADAGAA